MPVPISIHVFRKAPLGGTSSFIRSYPCFNYSHRKIARGGDDSAACSIAVSRSEGERIYAEFVGNLVQFYADNPIAPIFEGYISRVTLRNGGITATRSTDEMMNQVDVMYYSANSAAAFKTELTGPTSNTDSVGGYGTKQGTIDAGVHYNAIVKTHKVVLRNTLAAIRAYPQISVASNDRLEGTTLELEIKGLKDFAWGWQQYSSTDTTMAQPGVLFGEITARSDLALFPANGALIYQTGVAGSQALSQVATNTTFTMSHESRTGQSYLQFIQSICEAGDSTVQYSFKITRSDLFGKTRRVYYQPSNLIVKYTASANRDAGRVRSLAGVLIPGHLVEPDNGILINDMFANWAQPGDNPTVGFIETLEFDGETGRVKWQTGDSSALEGVMNAGKYFKRSGELYGSPVRPLV